MNETSKKFEDIPIDHLDFKYVEACNDVKELEKIYKILLSGTEGKYIELEQFTEEKIRKLSPTSRLLRKDNPIVNKNYLPNSEKQFLDEEINEFLKSIPNLEREIAKDNVKNQPLSESEHDLPPIRNSKVIVSGSNAVKPNKITSQPVQSASNSNKQAKPRDYREWEKIEKELEKDLEDTQPESQKEEPKKVLVDEHISSASKNKDLKKIPTKIESKQELSVFQKTQKAEEEKNKGNEAFKAKEYDEAVVYYTRSLEYIESPASYNNRAMAYLKLEKWDKVIGDCNEVFKFEKDNIKAHMRRGTAYYKKHKYNDALLDLKFVCEKEPHNKSATDMHENIQKALRLHQKEIDEVKSKGGKRIVIEESDGESESDEEKVHEIEAQSNQDTKKTINIQEVDEDDEDDNEEYPNKSLEIDQISQSEREKVEIKEQELVKIDENFMADNKNSIEIELPSDTVMFKDKANELFKSGQYGEAINYYTKAIDSLKSHKNSSSIIDQTFSILYSNRASCHQKIGDYKAAVANCDLSLSLRDSNPKVLYKKATSLEMLEKYQLALSEYEKIMQLDWTFKQAQDAYNRVKKTLIERGQYNRKPTYDELKSKGNEYFKQKDYEKACEHYTQCIELDQANLTGHLNRSICYIKLNKTHEALDDCNRVLKIESTNVKALYRRALTLRMMKKYDECRRDLERVLEIESNNQIARQELNSLKKEQATSSSISKKQTKSVEDSFKPIKIKNPTKLPDYISNSYEFIQAWNSINPLDMTTFCLLLEKIDAKSMSKLIGSKLDDDMLTRFVKVFHAYVDDKEQDGFSLVENRKLDKKHILNYMRELANTQRFDVIKLFLSGTSKQLIRDTLNKINTSDCEEVAKLYGLTLESVNTK